MIEIVMRTLGVEHPETYRTYQILIVAVCITFPASLPRHVTDWTVAPAIPISCLVYCCAVLFVEVFMYWNHGALSNNTAVTYFRLNFDFFDAFGTTFFAYMSQPNYFEVIKDLEKRDCAHQKRVPSATIQGCFGVDHLQKLHVHHDLLRLCRH